MSAQLQATLAGGLLALVGGFAATILWRWLDERREGHRLKRELLGAMNAILNEVRYNQAVLRTAIEMHFPDPPLPLRDDLYTRVQLLLAERLPEEAYEQLSIPYRQWQAGQIYGRSELRGGDTVIHSDTTVEYDICMEVLTHFEEALDALLEIKYDLEPTSRSLRSLMRDLRPHRRLQLRRSLPENASDQARQTQ